MENFQNILYPDTISCCKKDEDCPNYLYLSNNKYVKCHESCLACKGGTLNDCISCYNQIEYNKYSVLDKIKIDNLKISTSTEYYWENENHKKCIEKPDRTFLDEEKLTIILAIFLVILVGKVVILLIIIAYLVFLIHIIIII